MLVSGKLGNYCKFISGGTPSRIIEKYFQGEIPWITGADITDDVITIPREHITHEAISNSATNIVPRGNILLVTRTGVGKVAINDYDICISQDFTGIIPDPKFLLVPYLFRYLQSKKRYFKSLQRGATIQGITREVVLNLQIPLPPISEQQRIAAILDQADTLRQHRRRALARLDDLLQSVFLDMFGDPVRNEKGWEMIQVKRFCDLVRGSSPRPKSDPRYYSGPVPRLMVADLTRDGFFTIPSIDSLTFEGAERSRPMKAGDVVMAVSGNVGLVTIINIDCCIHDGFVGFRKLNQKIILSKFLMYTLHLLKQTHETRKAGAIFQNLTTTDIKNMEIILPPMHMQKQWDIFFEDYIKLITKYKGSISLADSLFNSLQQRAFRGEL